MLRLAPLALVALLTLPACDSGGGSSLDGTYRIVSIDGALLPTNVENERIESGRFTLDGGSFTGVIGANGAAYPGGGTYTVSGAGVSFALDAASAEDYSDALDLDRSAVLSASLSGDRLTFTDPFGPSTQAMEFVIRKE